MLPGERVQIGDRDGLRIIGPEAELPIFDVRNHKQAGIRIFRDTFLTCSDEARYGSRSIRFFSGRLRNSAWVFKSLTRERTRMFWTPIFFEAAIK